MTDTVKNVLETNINKMFLELVEEYDLKTGDISPEQAFELENIKDSLANLLGDYVHQNI